MPVFQSKASINTTDENTKDEGRKKYDSTGIVILSSLSFFFAFDWLQKSVRCLHFPGASLKISSFGNRCPLNSDGTAETVSILFCDSEKSSA